MCGKEFDSDGLFCCPKCEVTDLELEELRKEEEAAKVKCAVCGNKSTDLVRIVFYTILITKKKRKLQFVNGVMVRFMEINYGFLIWLQISLNKSEVQTNVT